MLNLHSIKRCQIFSSDLLHKKHLTSLEDVLNVENLHLLHVIVLHGHMPKKVSLFVNSNCSTMSSSSLRVVPLFETVKDLRSAGSVIRKLLSIDWYREHIIKNHNGHQEVLFFFFFKFMIPS